MWFGRGVLPQGPSLVRLWPPISLRLHREETIKRNVIHQADLCLPCRERITRRQRRTDCSIDGLRAVEGGTTSQQGRIGLHGPGYQSGRCDVMEKERVDCLLVAAMARVYPARTIIRLLLSPRTVSEEAVTDLTTAAPMAGVAVSGQKLCRGNADGHAGAKRAV